MIPFIAPVLGPSIGGIVSEALGWRWTFWLTVIIASPLQLLFFITYRETYRVRILELKASHLRKKTGNQLLRSKYEFEKGDLSKSRVLWKVILRPLKLLIFSPVVLLVGVCSAVGMSFVYVLITSLPEIYGKRYHMNKSVIGLTYWGIGVYIGVPTGDGVTDSVRHRDDHCYPYRGSIS